MATQFLEEEESMADLAARIAGRDRDTYRSFSTLKVESAFDDRVFVLYRPRGLDERGRHRPPEILTTLRVLNFFCSSTEAAIRIQDDQTGATLEVGYVPVRLFGHDVFMSIPPRLRLQWDARIVAGSVIRSLSYAVLIKTKNRSDYYSAGVTYCETLNRFRDLFPNVSLNSY